MNHTQYRCFCLGRSLLWVAVVAVSSSSVAQPSGKLRDLEGKISSIELVSGSEAIGGASVEDAVALLQQWAAFPVCFESRQFNRRVDGLTLAQALVKLRELKTEHNLAARDAVRLKAYEQMSTTEDPSTLIGFKRTTFRFTAHDVSVRSFLDQLVNLDEEYVWKNYGTRERPLIVIQPRNSSVLEFAVPSVCEDKQARRLYGPGGQMTDVLQAHGISRFEMGPRNLVPAVQINLCRGDLNARDALNLLVEAAGRDESWSLSGIKEMRLLTFVH